MGAGKGLVLASSGSLGDVGQNRGVSDLQENPNNLHTLLSNPVWEIWNFGFSFFTAPRYKMK